jgi:hypothetical protein
LRRKRHDRAIEVPAERRIVPVIAHHRADACAGGNFTIEDSLAREFVDARSTWTAGADQPKWDFDRRRSGPFQLEPAGLLVGPNLRWRRNGHGNGRKWIVDSQSWIVRVTTGFEATPSVRRNSADERFALRSVIRPAVRGRELLSCYTFA